MQCHTALLLITLPSGDGLRALLLTPLLLRTGGDSHTTTSYSETRWMIPGNMRLDDRVHDARNACGALLL